jgi:hypothetical protein
LPGASCFAFGSFRPVTPSAFNQRTTPEITGTLTRISADVSQDSALGPELLCRARRHQPRGGRAAGQQREARAGDAGRGVHQNYNRTVLSYFTKPLHDQLVRAFRERWAAERAVSEVERLGAGYSLALSAARKVGIVEFGQSEDYSSGVAQMLSTILLIILILILLGALPRWPHSARWGYGPSGAVGVILVIVLILVLWGHI